MSIEAQKRILSVSIGLSVKEGALLCFDFFLHVYELPVGIIELIL